MHSLLEAQSIISQNAVTEEFRQIKAIKSVALTEKFAHAKIKLKLSQRKPAMNNREDFEKWFNDNVKNFPFKTESERAAFKKYADIVWQASRKAAIPDGYKLVPVCPTHAMQRAIAQSVHTDGPEWERAGSIYKAMLAAAPEVNE